MRKIYVLIIAVFFTYNLDAQSYKSNKNEMENVRASNNYFWGYAENGSSETATLNALAEMRQKIAKNIDSRHAFMTIPWEKIMETYETFCTEYSPVNILIIGDEPEAKMFCYISKEDVKNVFDERAEDVKNLIRQADNFKQSYALGDALCRYYWSLMLCKSHPCGKDLKIFDESAYDSVKIVDFVESQVREINDNMRVSASIDTNSADNKKVILEFIYYDKNGDHIINNLRYEYNDGRGYRGPIRLNSNKGLAELSNSDLEKMNVKIGIKCYEGKEEADNQMLKILEVMKPAAGKVFDFNKEIDLKKIAKKNEKKNKVKEIKVDSTNNAIETERVIKSIAVADEDAYRKIMAAVETAIRNKNYAAAKPYFTEEAYNEYYLRLIDYGKAEIIGISDYKFLNFNHEVICRSLPMQFKFRNQTVINNVVFRFDPDSKKITSLSFRLSDKAEQDILGNERWKQSSRLTLINFMEDYQTAYALKRFDYMNSIFSEDALIIVGHVLKPTKKSDGVMYQNADNVELIKMNKEDYMKRLRKNFDSKEYINIRFTNTNFAVAAGADAEIYGVQVKQEYFSNNYGDVGYLFLLVDLRNELPIIHVRAWQPDETDYKDIINLHSFKF